MEAEDLSAGVWAISRHSTSPCSGPKMGLMRKEKSYVDEKNHMWEGGFRGALLWENFTFDTSYLSEIELGCQLLFYTVELDGITCFATLHCSFFL